MLQGRKLWSLILGIQLVKLAVILSQPDTSIFTGWFYGYASLPPYSIWSVLSYRPFDRTPYSALWYFFYYPRIYGYWTMNAIMFFLDSLFIIVIAKNHHPLYTYSYVYYSMYFLLASPQDFLIYLFIVLGRVRALFLGLAIATKLPLIPPWWNGTESSPLATWLFLFSGGSGASPDNWIRYALLGSAWTISLLLYMEDKTRYSPIGKILNRLKITPSTI